MESYQPSGATRWRAIGDGASPAATPCAGEIKHPLDSSGTERPLDNDLSDWRLRNLATRELDGRDCLPTGGQRFGNPTAGRPPRLQSFCTSL